MNGNRGDTQSSIRVLDIGRLTQPKVGVASNPHQPFGAESLNEVKMVHVVGGNVTPRVKQWLNILGINDFVHVSLQIESIDPLELKKSALELRQYLRGASALISVGKIADLILHMAFLDHGALPAGNEERKEIIFNSTEQCKRYIEGVINDRKYSILSGPPSSPKSS